MGELLLVDRPNDLEPELGSLALEQFVMPADPDLSPARGVTKSDPYTSNTEHGTASDVDLD